VNSGIARVVFGYGGSVILPSRVWLELRPVIDYKFFATYSTTRELNKSQLFCFQIYSIKEILGFRLVQQPNL